MIEAVLCGFLRILFVCLFRFRVKNAEVLRRPGPVLLVANHTSWLDAPLLFAALDPSWKFVTSLSTAHSNPLFRYFMINERTFPVDPASPYALRDMVRYLQNGGKLAIFPEGSISWSGHLRKLFDGLGFLIVKAKPTVISFYVQGADRSYLSRQPGWRTLFPRITGWVSDPLTTPEFSQDMLVSQMRKHLTDWLRSEMLAQQFRVDNTTAPQNLFDVIARMSVLKPGAPALEDYTRQSFSYRKMMLTARVLARVLADSFASSGAKNEPIGVGLLLPNANVMVLTLLALWRLRLAPAVLNYSSGMRTMVEGAKLANLKFVLTSRMFVQKAGLDVRPLEEVGCRVLFVEDLRKAVGAGPKLAALAETVLRSCSLGRSQSTTSGDAPAVILFTSGTEGKPKGVVLSHQNILANIRQLMISADLLETDRMFTALPLFHSYGLTVGALLPLTHGLSVFLYPSPLHFREIPTFVFESGSTVMISTNTFLSRYAKRAHPCDFQAVRRIFVGAEKVQQSTAELWARKFGVRLLEGYGVTECSPCISTNTAIDVRAGSVGKPLPGIELRIEPVPGVSDGGRLWVKGPNVMRQYLNEDANQHFQAQHGWYDTGDIVRQDRDGFLYIVGRLKRFAKVSGEMISLALVEEILASGLVAQVGLHCEIAVISRPDPGKGEMLIAVVNDSAVTQEMVRDILLRAGSSSLAIPRFVCVLPEIPKLGTGKTDYVTLDGMCRQEWSV